MKQFCDTLFCRTMVIAIVAIKNLDIFFFFEIHIKLLFPFIGFKIIRYIMKNSKNFPITYYYHLLYMQVTNYVSCIIS